jgi:uncharacterized protein (DUF2249 family)
MPTVPSTTVQGIPAAKIFDGVAVPCPIKHTQIVRRWQLLPVGDYFVLVNDHDPAGIHGQLDDSFHGCFRWTYLEQGPDVFAVRIDKLS